MSKSFTEQEAAALRVLVKTRIRNLKPESVGTPEFWETLLSKLS